MTLGDEFVGLWKKNVSERIGQTIHELHHVPSLQQLPGMQLHCQESDRVASFVQDRTTRKFTTLAVVVGSFMWSSSKAYIFKLRLPTDNNNTITVEKGVESNIDFFLNDYPSLNTKITIIVQHKRGSGAFERKCLIIHSKTGGCSVQFGPCQCVGEGPGSSYGYRLKMIFTSQDAGLLQVEILSHGRTSITLNVRESVSTTFPPTSTSTTVARPTTTSLPTIPTSTPTTLLKTRLVEAVTRTTPHAHHTPGPHHTETPNSVDSDDNKETGDGRQIIESQSSQSDNGGDAGENNNSSPGTGSVAVNTIIISFLVIASQWWLM